jgi:DNA helicase IV
VVPGVGGAGASGAGPPPSDPEIESEQVHLDRAARCLQDMRQRAEVTHGTALRMAKQEESVDARVVAWHTDRRRRELADERGGLCFGRIDTDDGDRWYVGRRHVADGGGDPVVVDWRAAVAVPFYRATVADPCGLERRRRYAFEGPTITALFDEDFTDPHATPFGGLPDPLLAELDRGRTGQMTDIVATIAAEQDVIIRAPLERALIVQGGPGTGKTAVALHRAAYLLFEHRDRLAERRVLVVGPNRTFLRYIAEVLPSLGESAVTQTTLEGLVAARWPVRAAESPEAVGVKGDERMLEVCRRLVDERIGRRPGPFEVAVGATVVRWSEAEVAAAVDRVRSSTLPHNEARSVLREVLVRDGWARHASRAGADPADGDAIITELRASPALNRALQRCWPSLNAAVLLRDLYRSPARRRRLAGDLFERVELDRLARPPSSKVADERWTSADVPLLDDLAHRCAGVPTTYGHVVVDEAQDLSIPAVAMLARRAERGSLTVLGDLAQSTGAAGLRSWDDAARLLTAAGAAVHRADLSVGYRVPDPVLSLANRLLPVIAPGVAPARSVRRSGDPPLVLATTADQVGAAVSAEVEALAGRWGSVGVIAAGERHDEIVALLQRAGVDAASSRRSASLSSTVTVLDPPTAKGLEFDAVVVVEPAVIAELPNGLRHLYVALTRPVQHLGIVHSRPLPTPLVHTSP